MASNDVANLPAFPGEDFYSHAASAYREQVEARLAELGWLAAAQGLQSEAVKAIVDIDLTRVSKSKTNWVSGWRPIRPISPRRQASSH